MGEQMKIIGDIIGIACDQRMVNLKVILFITGRKGNNQPPEMIGQAVVAVKKSNPACPHQKNPGIASIASTMSRERVLEGKPLILTGENGKGVRTGSIGSGSRIRVFRTRKRIIFTINKGEHDDV